MPILFSLKKSKHIQISTLLLYYIISVKYLHLTLSSIHKDFSKYYLLIFLWSVIKGEGPLKVLHSNGSCNTRHIATSHKYIIYL